MLESSTNRDSSLLLLDLSPSAHCLDANTQEKRIGGMENKFIQRLTPREERRQLPSKNHHLGET